ncbi:MAG: hypothetical protein OXS40_00310, partial [Gammaproteobacteria bacterium]|nr:hypothetical protein [Gammaproteobacteria bacterium]
MASEQTEGEALAAFAGVHGEGCGAEANRPVHFDDDGAVWLVERGAIDVLAAEFDGEHMVSPFRHVMRLGPGRLAFGAAGDGHSLRLVAKGREGTRLLRFSRDSLLAVLERPDHAESLLHDLIAQTDRWIWD